MKMLADDVKAGMTIEVKQSKKNISHSGTVKKVRTKGAYMTIVFDDGVEIVVNTLFGLQIEETTPAPAPVAEVAETAIAGQSVVVDANEIATISKQGKLEVAPRNYNPGVYFLAGYSGVSGFYGDKGQFVNSCEFENGEYPFAFQNIEYAVIVNNGKVAIISQAEYAWLQFMES